MKPKTRTDLEVFLHRVANLFFCLAAILLISVHAPFSLGNQTVPVEISPELVLQRGHSAGVNAIAFSPNGDLLASGSADKTIKLWDIASQRELRTLAGHKSGINALAFRSDGKWLASGASDGDIKFWDVATGAEPPGEQLVNPNDNSSVRSIAFSADDHWFAVGTERGIKLWDLTNKREPLPLPGHNGSNAVLAFGGYGKWLAYNGSDNTVQIWDLSKRSPIKPLSGHNAEIIRMAFSKDGKWLVAGGLDKRIRLWKTEDWSNQPLQMETADAVVAVAFNPNGDKLFSADRGNEIKQYDLQKQSWSPVGAGGNNAELKPTAIAFSNDARWFASSTGDKRIEIRDIATGLDVKILKAHSYGVNAAAFSSGGRWFATGGGDNTVKLWGLATGRELRTLDPHSGYVNSVAFSPDETLLVAGSYLGHITVWEAATGQLVRQFKGDDDSINAVAFSNDGEAIVSAGNDGSVRLWSVTGKQKLLVGMHKTKVNAVVFSTDGKWIVSGSSDGMIKIWEASTGKPLREWSGHTGKVLGLSFSPKERFVASCGVDGVVRIWEADTGELKRTLPGRGYEVGTISFSNDGRLLASGSKDTRIDLWETATGELKEKLLGHTNEVRGLAFSSDSRWLASGSDDGSTRLWNASTGKLAATLISLRESAEGFALGNPDSVVIDPDGRFDATEGAFKLLHYAYGFDVINLEQFKEEYFEPGLLQKLFAGAQLRAVVPLIYAKLPPEVVSQSIVPTSTILSIKLKNRGGGFGAVRVFVNDKLANADARDEGLRANPNPTTEFISLTVDLKDSAFVRGKICDDRTKPETCRDNKITIYTSNYLPAYQTSNMTSRSTEKIWPAGDNASSFKWPTLYAIVGGVSAYKGDSLRLKFAAKDAEDFSDALRLGAQGLFCDQDNPNCTDKVNITTLSTTGNPGTILSTKENFRNAFADVAAKAQPEDIVLIYLSGHGVSLEGTDTYFYLTQDAASTDKNDLTKNYRTVSITSNELLCWLTTTPCNEKEQQLEYGGKLQLGTKTLSQVVILDTCAAGKAGQTLALTTQKDLSTDQRRAIEFLKDKSGTHILMGSTADQPSYEASKFAQGLLTRALLEGMSGAALERVNSYVDVQTLFRYAENRVEKLAFGIGGIQRPTNAVAKGRTFPIGQMRETAQKRIAARLPKEKPYLLRPSFGNREKNNYDNLGLEDQFAKLLNDQNNPLLTKGSDAVLVYLNEDKFPGAIKPTGFYTNQNGVVTMNVSLYRDGERIAESIEVTGSESEIVGKLLATLRTELEKQVGNLKERQ